MQLPHVFCCSSGLSFKPSSYKRLKGNEPLFGFWAKGLLTQDTSGVSSGVWEGDRFVRNFL